MIHLHTDVAVIGVGAMGSATLWRLAERGIPAVGFEQFEPGHDRGSSHGECRIFRTAYVEGPAYVPLAQRAIECWHELQRTTGVDLIVPNGGLTLGPSNGTMSRRTMESIRVHDLPHRLLSADEIRAEHPMHRVERHDVAIFERQAGFVRPERAILAAVGRAEKLGVRILRQTRIDSIEPGPEGVRLTAGELVCDARHAVVTAGAWLGQLLPQLRLPLRVTRQIVGWFPVEHPQAFAPERFPIFMRDIGVDIATADSTFYGFPTLDGETIKAGIHREGEISHPDTLDRTITPADLEPIEEYVGRFLHGVGTHPVQTQVCMYTNTPDHDFLIGSPSGIPQITILGGFSGHGFKFASVMGEIGANLATNGATEYPVQWLSPDRFVDRVDGRMC